NCSRKSIMRRLAVLALLAAGCPTPAIYREVRPGLSCERATRVTYRTLVALGYKVTEVVPATPERAGVVSGTKPGPEGSTLTGRVVITCDAEGAVVKPVEDSLVPNYDFSRGFGYSFKELVKHPDVEEPWVGRGLEVLVHTLSPQEATLDLGGVAIAGGVVLVRVTVRNNTARAVSIDPVRIDLVPAGGTARGPLAGDAPAGASAPKRSGAGAPAPAHPRLGTSPSPTHARLHLPQPRLQLIPARARGAPAGRAQQLACLRLLPVLGEQRYLRDARLVPGGAARWARVEDAPPVGEGVCAVALRRGRARRAAERLGRRAVRLEHLLIERARRGGVAGAEIQVREDDPAAGIAALAREDGVDLARQGERGRLLGGRRALGARGELAAHARERAAPLGRAGAQREEGVEVAGRLLEPPGRDARREAELEGARVEVLRVGVALLEAVEQLDHRALVGRGGARGHGGAEERGARAEPLGGGVVYEGAER